MINHRCISIIRHELTKLGFHPINVRVGEVELLEKINKNKLTQLNTCLKFQGFEILDQKRSKVMGQIKMIIIEQIHYPKGKIRVNFSSLLSQKNHQDYKALNHLFSEIEGMTIDQYILFQRIEKVKELLIYSNLTSSQIADFMNFNSVPDLSGQFKKLTGLTLQVFKALKNNKQVRPIT